MTCVRTVSRDTNNDSAIAAVPIPSAISSSTSSCRADKTSRCSCRDLGITFPLRCVPAGQVTGIGGFMDAVATVFAVYGPAGPVLLDICAALFVFALMNQGAAWMIVSDRMQAIAAADGAFFGGYFGVFHERLGTPVRMNVLSGVVATLFMVAASVFVSGSSAAIFTVVLTIAITTLLLSYLIILPAAIRLRTRYRDVQRPYQVPGGRSGMRLLAGVCLGWIALGSWAAVFPGTLERLLGIRYDFESIWGVSQATFEAFTLSTLAALIVLAGAGYWSGRSLRTSARERAAASNVVMDGSEAP